MPGGKDSSVIYKITQKEEKLEEKVRLSIVEMYKYIFLFYAD